MKYFKNVLFVISMTMSSVSSATMVTLFGNDVSFTFDDGSMFGSGLVVGNSLIFQPTDFKAESLNGAGVDTASDTLIIDVLVTTMGFDITSLGMFEQGDYITDGVDASVKASGRLGVLSTTQTCGFLACNDYSIFNVTGLGNTGGSTVDWSGGTNVDLADTSGWGSDTGLQISFQNNLSATTINLGEEAMIQKKLGAIGLAINEVPVPAAFWLFGSGLFALVTVFKRKQS